MAKQCRKWPHNLFLRKRGIGYDGNKNSVCNLNIFFTTLV